MKEMNLTAIIIVLIVALFFSFCIKSCNENAQMYLQSNIQTIVDSAYNKTLQKAKIKVKGDPINGYKIEENKQ